VQPWFYAPADHHPRFTTSTHCNPSLHSRWPRRIISKTMCLRIACNNHVRSKDPSLSGLGRYAQRIPLPALHRIRTSYTSTGYHVPRQYRRHPEGRCRDPQPLRLPPRRNGPCPRGMVVAENAFSSAPRATGVDCGNKVQITCKTADRCDASSRRASIAPRGVVPGYPCSPYADTFFVVTELLEFTHSAGMLSVSPPFGQRHSLCRSASYAGSGVHKRTRPDAHSIHTFSHNPV
jgi:hypothetical protein